MVRFTVLLAAMLILIINCAIAITVDNNSSFISECPVAFTENRGQWDKRVLFKAEASGGLIWFIERDGFTILYTIPDLNVPPDRNPRNADLPEELQDLKPKKYPLRHHALKFRFIDLQQPSFLYSDIPAGSISTTPENRLSWDNNYFYGNDPSGWVPNCGNYKRVTSRDVWDGINIEWYSVDGNIEFDFIVYPNSAPERIGLQIDGITDKLIMTPDDREVMLPTSLGALHLILPEAWQVANNGKTSEIGAAFEHLGENKLGFTLPEGYEPGKKLVIDPMVFSTFLGGRSYEVITSVFANPDNSIVVAGRTRSPNFPDSEGVIQDEFAGGDNDAFFSCLNEDCSELIYSTYLGGEGDDIANAIIHDGAEGIYAVGVTDSPNFPVVEGSFQMEFGGGNSDGFMAHISNNGCELIYSTFIGGSARDEGEAVTVINANEVIIAGESNSLDYPVTEDAFQIEHRNDETTRDVVISYLNLENSELVYSTYIGGRSNDAVRAIIPADDGGVIFTGRTMQRSYPTTEGAFQEEVNGHSDIFVTHLSEDGQRLISSTLLGGGSTEIANAVIQDGEGGVVLTGSTQSRDFPVTEGVFQPERGRLSDAFIARLSGDGRELICSSYLGGGTIDEANAIVSDGFGGWIVGGKSGSDDFPFTEGALQTEMHGIYDAFITRVNGDLSRMIYSSYLGGDEHDNIFGITTLDDGDVVVAGYTQSDDFPTTDGAFQERGPGGGDTFITRFSDLAYLLWEEIPEGYVAFESEMVEFDLIGKRSDEGGELSIVLNSPDLPDAATIEDHGDGSGRFLWQTDFQSAGEFTAVFTLTDGELELETEIQIIVLNVNSPPRSFAMLAPENEYRFLYDPDSLAVVDFIWEESLQDESDTDSIRYRIVYTVGENRYAISSLDSTHCEISIQALADSMGLDRETDITFSWSVRARDSEDQRYASNQPWTFTIPALGVDTNLYPDIPEEYFLSSNYPNPFNSSTTIEFGIPIAGMVELSITNINGRRIHSLVSDRFQAGRYRAVWDAVNHPTGVYLVIMQSEEFNTFQKVLLIR